MSTGIHAIAQRLLELTDLTTVLADALEGRTEDGGVVPLPRLPRTSARRLCGPAAVLRLRPAGAGERLSHDPLLARATPGAVAVIDAAGHPDGSVLGGRLARLGRSAGLQGYVVHGAVRDLKDLDDLRLPLWSTLTHPAGARQSLIPDPEALSVTLGGVRIDDGDLLAADANGVVVVRAGALADVSLRAETIAAQEEQDHDVGTPVERTAT